MSTENQPLADKLGVKRDGTFMEFYKIIINPAMNSLSEMGRLFPDSILFGTLLLYVITQHLPYGVFGIFLIETSLAQKLVSFLIGKIVPIDGPSKTEGACRPGFHKGRLEFERTVSYDYYPSVPVFFTGAVASYLYGTLITFAETLKAMGVDWQGRAAVASIFIAISVLTFVYSKTGCHDYTELGIALGLGIVTGILFYFINYRVFGVEGMNFLGLPYLIDKTKTDHPLYVCVPNSVTGK